MQVETAVKFLKNPKIAPSPLATKKAFLKSKGLSDAQIEEACRRSGVSTASEAPSAMTSLSPSSSPMMKNYPLIATNPQNSWLTKLRDFANFVLIMGSAAYGLHFLWRVRPHMSHFVPHFDI